MSIEIVTPRLLLSSIDESHVDQVVDFVARNKTFLEAWEPARTADYYTAEAQLQLIANDCLNMAREQLFKVWLYKKDDPTRIIGSIALNNIVRGVFQSCHLGYRIDEAENGKGFMTEGLTFVIEQAFHQLHLHRIEANIMPRNQASLRVVEKLGFSHEGLARKYLKINGKWEDHIHMVLLNEELQD
ncbi:GNAT family N-acetyltransferase [Cohnella lubricantis]|uniref:GNAT family N-acetyltransferase n=1 Tax=Cohnella lubricantis TaxID=2163172 RepID=A0A841TCT6_9BACL|nr:GNAT family N-acetyltransferase [Cohnella lubricantis]MBB6677825.1 GNAT family N-acetyltransferase [Cohnella lubricantis]MBP2120500.1 ribosomal-protein-alanine N-acetyltransferase [Cohnella lubricantis]